MKTSTISATGIVGEDGRAVLSVTCQERCLVGMFYATGEGVAGAKVERIGMGGADRGIAIVDTPIDVADMMRAMPPHRLVLQPGTTLYFTLRCGYPGAEYRLGFFVELVP